MRRLVPKRNQSRKPPYTLVVKYMHGDADFYTTETLSAKTEAEIIELYDTMTLIADAMQRVEDMTVAQLSKALGPNQKAKDLLEDVPYDAAYEGSGTRAIIDGLKILKEGIEMEIIEA